MFSDSDSDSDQEFDQNIKRRKVIERINFNIDNFEETFRISRTLAEQILQQIAPIINHETFTNNALTAEQQLLTTLRFLGTNAFYSVIGHAHGMDKSTVSRAIHRTVKALNDQLFQNIVKWPDRSIAQINCRTILCRRRNAFSRRCD